MQRYRRRKALGSAMVVAALAAVAGCGSAGHAKSGGGTSAAAAYAQGGPGFTFTLSGAVTGQGTPANAGSLPSGAPPSGTVGAGGGLAFCGPQPSNAQKFGGTYALATRFDLPQTVLVRLVVPNYSAPGSYPAAGSGTSGAVLQISGDLRHAQAGQITITDARNGTVNADFDTSKGAVHVTGTWRCP